MIAAALTVYTLAADAIGIDEAQLRTGATLILTIVGLWVLIVLSRPVTALKAVVIGAMMIALVLMYTIPIVTDFLQLVDPGSGCRPPGRGDLALSPSRPSRSCGSSTVA